MKKLAVLAVLAAMSLNSCAMLPAWLQFAEKEVEDFNQNLSDMQAAPKASPAK